MLPLLKTRRLLRGLGVPLLLGVVITAGAPGWTNIRVAPGDTLTVIAARYHTTVAALIALNHLPGNGNLIYAGQLLRVPVPPPPPPPRASQAGQREAIYVVRAGDTVDAIAARYHIAAAWIAARNHLPASGLILVGQHLVVLVPPVVRPAAPKHWTYPPQVTAAANRDRARMAHIPVPSQAAVRAMVVAASKRFGLDPNLALAVSYQESGYQQGVVSPADAIGAMQVLPSTGGYVSQYVVHRPLNLFNAADNVTAGVALLAQLTHAAPVDKAVAGYYQGLGSVLSQGMYADTKAYVASVLALRSSFAAGH